MLLSFTVRLVVRNMDLRQCVKFDDLSNDSNANCCFLGKADCPHTLGVKMLGLLKFCN